MNRDRLRPALGRTVLSGLAAGAVAAIVTSIASLALHSPDLVLINSATVSLAVLLSGILAGIIYWAASKRANPLPSFAAAMAGLFLLAVLGSLLMEALPGHPVENVASYFIPLAAISLALDALLTPLLAGAGTPTTIAAPVLTAVALVAGVALAARQAPSGHLTLPQAAAPAASTSAAGDGLIRLSDVKGLAFAVDPTQSKATYSVQEQLTRFPAPDNAVGTTSQVSGTIFLDGRPSTVSVDLKTFKSDDRGRDGHLLFDPGLAKFGPAQFTVSELNLPSTYKPGHTITMNVPGMLTINNVQKPITFAVDARFQDNTISIHGQTAFTFQDFNITPPTYKEVLKVDNTIHAEVLLVARSQ